jgi:hypothetical protein
MNLVEKEKKQLANEQTKKNANLPRKQKILIKKI